MKTLLFYYPRSSKSCYKRTTKQSQMLYKFNLTTMIQNTVFLILTHLPISLILTVSLIFKTSVSAMVGVFPKKPLIPFTPNSMDITVLLFHYMMFPIDILISDTTDLHS
ncbi:hypothetical protein V6Z11_D09G027500 [Gossypium hirsutum]